MEEYRLIVYRPVYLPKGEPRKPSRSTQRYRDYIHYSHKKTQKNLDFRWYTR